MAISKRSIDRVKEVPIHNFFPDYVNLGNKYVCKCPNCGSEYNKKKSKGGFIIKSEDLNKKNSGYCFSCQFGLTGAINTYAFLNRLDPKKDFIQIVTEIAEKENIELEEDNKKSVSEYNGKPIPGSFVHNQLKESGLSVEDITAEVIENGEYVRVPVFQRGSLNIVTGEINYYDNEMLIVYYDLEGKRKKYLPKGSRSIAREKDYTRVRWSNPEGHLDKAGRPVKYQTPLGAKAEIYIPQAIRAKYKNKVQFDTLIIQEGEKKAEKACKHGIDSIGIQGIYNIGTVDSGLPKEIQYIVQNCGVKNIVLLFDADWQDLSRNIGEEENVDARPRQFAKAAIKFKRFIKSLHQIKLSVDIWIGHINKNNDNAKGIDDLLHKCLQGNEELLKDDIQNAMLDIKGLGCYVSLNNITTANEHQIFDIWSLNSIDDFFEIHKSELANLKSFQFDRVFYTNVDGDFKKASEYGQYNEFWDVEYDPETGKKKIKMSIIEVKSFLEANGFRSHVNEEGNNKYVRVESGIIKNQEIPEIHRYVFKYVSKASKDRDVLESYAATMEKILSPSKLNLLEPLVTNARMPEQYVQRFFYKNAQIAINDSGIEVEALRGPVWEDNLINREFSRIKIFEDIYKMPDGSFNVTLTDQGKESEFVKYLINVSTFNNEGSEEAGLNLNHLVNKITCIGYLLRSYKSYIESKVVIAMDARMSEVGESNGRSGKSLIGMAIKQMVKQTMIGGRELKDSDEFILTEVTKTTDNIFIDDIKVNFNFGALYSAITGDMMINVKGGKRFTIPFENAPKIFMTTNHAIKSEGDSTDARTIFMAFSDYYNIDFTPAQDFGHQLFADWDDRQWSLFDNLMIECVFYYMKAIQMEWSMPECGAVPPPMKMINLRRERQNMGEAFFQWADSYFSPDGSNLNSRHYRQDLFNQFHKDVPGQLKFVSATSFKKKVISFCEYKRWSFNPHKKHKNTGEDYYDWVKKNPDKCFIGADDKTGGKEYFTIGDNNFDNQQYINIF